MASGPGGWRVAGASRAGPHHDENQDRWGSVGLPSGRTVVVVSDGAGSAPRAADGAQRAVLAALSAAVDGPGASEVAAACVDAAVAELGSDRQFAATLTVLVLDDPAVPDAVAAVAAVGDSPAMWRLEHGWELCLLDSDSEYANVTTFLTSPDAPRGLWEVSLERVTAAAVGSDGLDHPTIARGVPVTGFYDPLVARAAAGELDLDALLEWMASGHRLADDTTVVLAWRGPAAHGRP